MNPNQNLADLHAAIDAARECKEWQFFTLVTQEWVTTSRNDIGFFLDSGNIVRAKPVPPWSLPAPPEGREWHRADWTEDMLPEGWRPVLEGENYNYGDMRFCCGDWVLRTAHYKAERIHPHSRTRRPLPTPPTLRPWTKDEMPTLPFEVINSAGLRSCVLAAGDTHCYMAHTTRSVEYKEIADKWKRPCGSPCGVMEEGK